MRILFLISNLFIMTMSVCGQVCSELLSRAEQAYRSGSLEEIRQIKFCACFGMYESDSLTKRIKPSGYDAMIKEMKKADTLYGNRLGVFEEYWRDFLLPAKEYERQQDNFFSATERNRAFILLGRLYDQLGAIRLSEYFALKAILIEPNNELNNDSTGFNRTYSEEMGRVREWSAGPLLSWMYTLPVAIKNNIGGVPDFRYQSDGKIVLGLQFNYFFKPTALINAGILINSTRTVYTQKRDPSTNDFDFSHTEKQNWIRIPVLFKWTSKNALALLKNNGRPTARIFFATGFALDYLTSSKATITDLKSGTALYDYPVESYRNRFNYEYLLQVMARFSVGHNYLNFGLTGSYLLRDMVNQKLVAAGNNQLYTQYGVKEDNYKMVTGAWIVSYDFMFNRIKNRNGYMRGQTNR